MRPLSFGIAIISLFAAMTVNVDSLASTMELPVVEADGTWFDFYKVNGST